MYVLNLAFLIVGINLKNWDIYGVSQPDAIKYFKKSDGTEYIITANEGDSKVMSQRTLRSTANTDYKQTCRSEITRNLTILSTSEMMLPETWKYETKGCIC